MYVQYIDKIKNINNKVKIRWTFIFDFFQRENNISFVKNYFIIL